MIELNQIIKKYEVGKNETLALNDISLKIEKNDFIAVMGTSGSGKSTLLNILGGMDQATSGQYLFEGSNISNLSNKNLHEFRKNNISFIFQNFALINRYTVYENIEIPLLARNQRYRKEKIMEIMKRIHIEDLKSKYPQNLSGGQQQRCAIARALVTDSKLLLCDEPTGSLDSHTSMMIMDILSDINSLGKTIVLVTHDERIASRCHQIINIEDGKII